MSASPAARAAIPNALTLARLALTAIFVALLAMYTWPARPAWALPAAAILFIIAAATDALDGHLARKWSVVSVFGRVMDPFADKVLVLGAFIMMAGPGFIDADTGRLVSGAQPWIVVVILARELLVTSLRGVYESQGVSFAADWSGKAKMILQSIAIPAILLILWLAPPGDVTRGWARWAIDILIWATLAITIISCLPYLVRSATAHRAAGARPKDKAP